MENDMTTNNAKILLDGLKNAYDENVRAGRGSKFTTPSENSDTPHATYHSAHAGAQYDNVKVSAWCDGFNPEDGSVRYFSMEVGTAKRGGGGGGFPLANYEALLHKIMGEKYERTEEKRRTPVSKNEESEKAQVHYESNNSKFIFRLENNYERDEATGARGDLKNQNIALFAFPEMTPLADVEYTVSAVHTAIGLE